MSKIKNAFQDEIEIKSIWKKLPHDDAYEIFDVEGLKPADISPILGNDISANYANWLYMNVK